ncbi:MAG: flagellar motor protein [Candidatus Eisenbacteria bacterium]
MDPLFIVGLCVAAAAILGGQALEGGHLASLVQLPAFLIVVGGTLGAVLVQTPLPTFVDSLRLLRWMMFPPSFDLSDEIPPLVEWAGVARREGMLQLDRRLAEVPPGFTHDGLELLVSGASAARIQEALEIEIAAYEFRYRAATRMWESAGGYSPTIGILGAVLGLIHVMENLSDPSKVGDGIAVAFVATVYGVGLANLVFLPVANKMKSLIAVEVRRRELLLDGFLGIATGENPKMVASRLSGHLAA